MAGTAGVPGTSGMPARADYDYPFRIDAGSGQAGQTGYPNHVDQMLRQLLLTDPGERTCLPTFGCGLRQLLFAPQSDALTASVTLQVQQAVAQWLSDQVTLNNVQVTAGAGADPSLGLDEGEVLITISYTVVDTLTPSLLTLKVS
jgi:phage baseplate assembly protein W